MALSTSVGKVLGGHVMSGCIVRTTAEVLLGLLHGWKFSREPDALTGYSELVIQRNYFLERIPVTGQGTDLP